jgi:cytoskeletal protein RodZ
MRNTVLFFARNPLTRYLVLLQTSAVSAKASKLDQQTISLARKPKPKPKKKKESKATEGEADAEEGTADDAKAGANATESDAGAESATPEGAEPLEEPTPAAEEGDQVRCGFGETSLFVACLKVLPINFALPFPGGWRRKPGRHG